MTKQMMVILVLVAYAFICSVFIEPNSLTVNTYQIENQRLQGIRIAFLSDLHLKKHAYKRVDKIVQTLERYNPDLILLGGDYPDSDDPNKMMDIDIFAQKLNLISAPKIAVLGSQDWKTDGEEIAKQFRKNNIYVLENSARRVMVHGRTTIDIIGLADYNTRKINIAKAFLRTKKPKILLTHNPDVYYDILDETDLILAGHTHGGQVVLPFTSSLFVPSKYGSEFASGLINSTHNKMIISKGLGTSIIPVRFNCKPEIVMVDFVKKGAATTKKKRARYLK